MAPQQSNPLTRLQEQLKVDRQSGLIPPDLQQPTTCQAAVLFSSALEQSRELRIISTTDQENLNARALQFNAAELIEANTFVNLLNSLVRVTEVSLEQANNLMNMLCCGDQYFAPLLMKRILEDLGRVDSELEELRIGGIITESHYVTLSNIRIGLDRADAVFLSKSTAKDESKGK